MSVPTQLHPAAPVDEVDADAGPGALAEFERRFAGIAVIVVLLLAWEAAARWLIPAVKPSLAVLIPPPSEVLHAAITMARSGELLTHVVASSQRVLIAWALVVVTAVPLGIAMGWSTRFNRYVDPLIELLRPIPPLAWIPISILWFGIGITQNLFIIMIGVFFPVLLNTIHGVRGIEPVLIRAARNLGAPPRKLLTRVVLMGALPAIFNGIRIGLGVAWMVLVAAELVAATSGLGYMIQDARNFLRTDIIFMGMFMIGFMGILMDVVLRFLARPLLSWHHGSGDL
ncbi:MAG: ABC transporter permease [Proteobacteria bacterium]|nr:ABC transporter permease [Pseudomonadota bacterium]